MVHLVVAVETSLERTFCYGGASMEVTEDVCRAGASEEDLQIAFVIDTRAEIADFQLTPESRKPETKAERVRLRKLTLSIDNRFEERPPQFCFTTPRSSHLLLDSLGDDSPKARFHLMFRSI